MNISFKRIHEGFTLIELAMVLFIVGLLLGGLLVPFATSVEQKERADTEKILEEIKEALYGFAIVYGRLPCPDCEASSGCVFDPDDVDDDGFAAADDGLEDLDVSSGVCEVNVGNLPWATLNVPQFDAWGYAFTYRVTAAYSRNIAAYTAVPPCNSATGLAAFDLCTLGDMNISRTVNGAANVAQGIPAIVVSHGKNHYSDDQIAVEMENYKRNPRKFGETNPPIMSTYNNVSANTFVYGDYTLRADGSGVAFDDLMVWISPFILKNKLINAGKLP
jgi:prepilin-type N-terminal cleavage/methylation domain-containing protein